MATSAVRVIPGTVGRLRTPIVDGSRAARNAVIYLRQFQAGFQREASRDYERVPEGNYRRTGNLGRGWRVPGAITYGNDYTLTLENPVPYSGNVQGPRGVQAEAMRRRGWRGSETLAREVERTVNRRFVKEFFSR